MKVLLLCSGGDAPGMNYCIHSILKRGYGIEFYGAIAGFKGLIEGNFIKLDKRLTNKYKDMSGAFIKSSRCPEFKTPQGIKSACKNIKKHNFDCVIVLGGDGSYRGCLELINEGINIIFIPATIDRDMQYETYTIGFLTAVNACVEYISNVINTLRSFDKTGVFEVMGRDNSSICKMVAEIVEADYAVYAENINQIKFNQAKPETKTQIIILQEKLVDLNQFCEKLSKELKTEVKGCRIGYLQRGTNPLKEEKRLANIFAKVALKSLKQKEFGVAISLSEGFAQTVELN